MCQALLRIGTLAQHLANLKIKTGGHHKKLECLWEQALKDLVARAYLPRGRCAWRRRGAARPMRLPQRRKQRRRRWRFWRWTGLA